MFKGAVNEEASLLYETPAMIVQSIPSVSILVLEGDESSLEDAVNNCSIVFPPIDIIRETSFENGIFVARVQYKYLLFSTRQQLERQLQPFKSRINIQWKQTHL